MAAIIFLLIFVLVSISNLINGGLIMNVNTGIKQAVILAIGIIVLGFCVKSGLESVIAKDSKVVVKGLATTCRNSIRKSTLPPAPSASSCWQMV